MRFLLPPTFAALDGARLAHWGARRHFCILHSSAPLWGPARLNAHGWQRNVLAAVSELLSEGQPLKTFSLLGFLAELPAIERDLHASGPKIIEKACQIVQKRAKANIGRDHEAWAPLAASTIADKARHGFPTPKPLLRTGEMRDSIEYQAFENIGFVGSSSEVALAQEMGTSRIPARSFLRSAAIASEDKIHRMAAATTIAALSGYGHNAHSVREILHLAGHVLREFKELGEDLLGDDEDNEGGRKK